MKKASVLNFNEAKKHSIRYDEPRTLDDKDSVARSVYINKSVFAGVAKAPEHITITVEW